MATIQEEIVTASNWMAAALLSSGYNADFSPNSFPEVERFFNEHSANGFPRPDSFLAHEMESRIFAMGCYIGEVIRRAKAGEWRGSDSDPNVKVNLELRLPDGSVCWPTQRAMSRLKNGASDSIVAYGLSFGVAAGGASSAKKGFFKRLLGR
jgi:hypothetical protein